MKRDTGYKGGSPEEDIELIKAFQSGERIAFDRLVLAYKDHVFNLCYRFLSDFQEAEDVSQEIFFKAYKSLKKFRFKSSFYTWLYRIAVNTCINRLKSLEFRNIKKNFWTDSSKESENAAGPTKITDGSINPEIELEKKERERIIQDAINSLPSEHKEVIILRDVEGLSYEEITDITGLRTGTLKSRLSRARHRLQTKLKDIL